MSSSDAPKDASPSSWENCAKPGFARSGMCPKSSWQQSLQNYSKIKNFVLCHIYFSAQKSYRLTAQEYKMGPKNDEYIAYSGTRGMQVQPKSHGVTSTQPQAAN